MTRTNLVVAALSIALFALSRAADPAPGYATLRAKDLEFSAELSNIGIRYTLLPYQGFTVLLTLRNVNREGKRLGPLCRLENAHGIHKERYLGIKGPNDKEFQTFGESISFLDLMPRDGDKPTELEARSARSFYLEPGWATAYQFSLIGDWYTGVKDERLRKVGLPLFPRPGKYKVKFGYPLDAKGKNFIEETFTIDVEAPEGDDEKIVKMLGADPALASVMMSPVHVPDAEQKVQLKKLVKDYPESSYARYARFALARGCVGGAGNTAFTEEQGKEAIKELGGFLKPLPYVHSPNEWYLWSKAQQKQRNLGCFCLDYVTRPEYLHEAAQVVPDFVWDKYRKFWPHESEFVPSVGTPP